jgi:membrane protein implicated in regulation of membrane protease activity
MQWWSWIVLGGLLLVAEVFLPTDFFLVFFGIAALLLGLLGLLGIELPVPAQWLLFAVLSVVSLWLLRKRIKARLDHSMPGVDALIGKTGIARDGIAPGGTGRIELHGTTWAARNRDDRAIHRGDECRVEAVEGVTLDVRLGDQRPTVPYRR